MEKAKPLNYWERTILTGLQFTKTATIELCNGVLHDRIDLLKYVYPGIAVSGAFVLHLDGALGWVLNSQKVILNHGMRAFVVYTGLASGWVIWAAKRAIERTKLLNRLRGAFLFSNLQIQGRIPAFIEDVPLDDNVRNLKLFTRGLPIKHFTDKREELEGYLNISIVKIRDENGDKGRVNILYAMQPLTTRVDLEDMKSFNDGEIPIGISFEGPLTVNLRDIAHLLLAGQTGSGKSNFQKVVTTVLVYNNPSSDVYFLDFKGGMELADITNKLGDSHANFHNYAGPSACAKFLAELGEKIESRLTEIAKLGASSLDEYLVKRLAAKPNANADSDGIERPQDILKRTYLVIDEINQLYARDSSVSKEDLVKARAAVNRIARQGRAAGIHLIVAVQKPDAQNFDQTVKANLPAILCFPVTSTAASVSALGCKRAFDLEPEIKGRAIWKFGPKLSEVQTYRFE